MQYCNNSKLIIMHVTFMNSYPKLVEGKIKLDKDKNPIIVFKYRWHGTQAELSSYKEALALKKDSSGKPREVIEDDKGPLYFSPFYVGEKADLHVSTTGKLYVDTSLIDAANSLIKQHGKLGELLAMNLLKEGFSAPRESQVTEVTSDEPIDQ